MDRPLIMFQNITVATRAKNILEASGIHGYVQKTPKIGEKVSCGYSVYVPKETDRAEQILRNKGVFIIGRTGGDNK